MPIKTILVLVPIILSEVLAAWWTKPRPHGEEAAAVLNIPPPSGEDWTFNPELYQEVQPSLRCSSGWMGLLAEPDGPGIRFAYFAWDEASTLNTFEAFKHLPEQCMGSIGMRLEDSHPARQYVMGQHLLNFDSTQFRPAGGGMSVFIFKCVWVSGLEKPDLRDGIVWGGTGVELRRLRIAAAATRFKPRHTRVIMGAVGGIPSESLAWHRFTTQVLDHVRAERIAPDNKSAPGG